MPTIAYFYGIAIQMFFNDHSPPHFHAHYGSTKALIRISDGKIISGELPPTARPDGRAICFIKAERSGRKLEARARQADARKDCRSG